MGLLAIVVFTAVVLLLAYRIYGSWLVGLLELDDRRPTPAVTLRDDVDYAPIDSKFLLSQHFSAIAAAGPIVGPILAGLMFGWLPALIWILVGSILIGGVHDIGSLVASIRHRALSIGQVVREHMTRRSYVLFLLFIWVALVYIIVAFTDIVASSFVGTQTLEDGSVISGGATATSSLLYLVLPIVMGLLLKYTKMSLNLATAIFLPLIGVAVWIGPMIPLDLQSMLGVSKESAIKIWDVLLLVYCLIAGAVPVWLLLQPRGHLGGYFLFITLAGAMVGIIIGGVMAMFGLGQGFGTIDYPAFRGWTVTDANGVSQSIAPILFITIACGACSGFHCLIASGTTSKQLHKETDAKLVGYGAMLMEAMVAVVALGCVMVLTIEAAKGKAPNLIYALGSAEFLGVLGIPKTLAISFALLAFTTFVYDTLDVCTRLGRFIVQELTGVKGALGRWIGTGVTAAVPLYFVMQTMTNAKGEPIAAWRVFWHLFGASNQLLAALALIGVTVWLWRTRRAWWVWPVFGLPTVFMYIMSMWALLSFVLTGFFKPDWSFAGLPKQPVPWAALVLIGLAALVAIEAVRMFRHPSAPSGPVHRESEGEMANAAHLASTPSPGAT